MYDAVRRRPAGKGPAYRKRTDPNLMLHFSGDHHWFVSDKANFDAVEDHADVQPKGWARTVHPQAILPVVILQRTFLD